MYISKLIFLFFITDTYKTYQNAIKLHSAWLNTQSHPNDMVHDIIKMYESAMLDMKNKLTSNLFEYDIHTITLAIIFMTHVSTKKTLV